MVTPYINHGRWVIDCPQCANAELATNNLTFHCQEAFGGCGYSEVFTYPAQKVAIETVLALRPNLKNRNWLPHETVGDLNAENARHGIS